MSSENLRPIKKGELSKEEAKERGSKGGKASVVARRKKKTMREMLRMALYEWKLADAVKDNLRQQGISEDDMNHLAVGTRSLIAKMEAGDVEAYKTVCAMLGESPKNNIDLSVSSKMVIEMVDAGVEPVGSEDEIETE